MSFLQTLSKKFKRAIDFIFGQPEGVATPPPPVNNEPQPAAAPPPLIYERGTMREAIHECGHFVVTYLHNAKFHIVQLTINKEISRRVNPTYNGGLRFRWQQGQEPAPTEMDPADKVSQVALAGICAATIFKLGPAFARANLRTLTANNFRDLDVEGADVDLKFAVDHTTPLSFHFQTDPVTTLRSVFRFDFEFLLDQQVWDCVTSLATELYNKENQTMSPDELTTFVTNNGFANYMATVRPQLLAGRYPIDAAKLSLI